MNNDANISIKMKPNRIYTKKMQVYPKKIINRLINRPMNAYDVAINIASFNGNKMVSLLGVNQIVLNH
jgi:hypothetical protein